MSRLVTYLMVAVPSSSLVPADSRTRHITATSLELFLLTHHSARTLSSLAQFLSGMHSIGRLSRAIPWTSSGIACYASTPRHQCDIPAQGSLLIIKQKQKLSLSRLPISVCRIISDCINQPGDLILSSN